MNMKKTKKIFSLMLACLIATSISVPAVSAANSSNNTTVSSSASKTNINDKSVFVKQQTSYTCTLASNVMMLRRAAILRGDSDWSKITESSCKPTLWSSGMKWNYTYKNFSVKMKKFTSGKVNATLKDLLKQHPEGIVVYDYNYLHAILVTDYTNGKFYGADPARNVAAGRIETSKSLINVSKAEAYWYVDSTGLTTCAPGISSLLQGVSSSETTPSLGFCNLNFYPSFPYKTGTSQGTTLKGYTGNITTSSGITIKSVSTSKSSVVSVSKVSSTKYTYTAKATGTATLTISYSNGKKQTIKITVI